MAITADIATVAVTRSEAHRLWTRVCHWLLVAGFLGLAFSGFVILMAHPRLYWGEVGNALTPAILELPISNNHRPEGWDQAVVYSDYPNAEQLGAEPAFSVGLDPVFIRRGLCRCGDRHRARQA